MARFTQECEKNDAQIEIEAANLAELKKEQYSDDVKKAIRYLFDKIDEYSLTNTYKMIFDSAIFSFKQEHHINRIVGNWYRYDLYAELLFAMKFFGHANGTTRFMCIDEGQDLTINEFNLLYALNQKNVIFIIYGDTNQLIKNGRGISEWSELDNIFRATNYKLNENYRNTNQITRFCNKSFNMDVLRTGVDGPSVQDINRSELEGELSKLKINIERIAVLLPRSVQKNRYIHRNEMPYYISERIGDEIDNGRIAVKYVDEVKGIEFDRVYVISNKMSQNEKYIAYTRAL